MREFVTAAAASDETAVPAGRPTVIMAISKLAGMITGPETYTNSFATAANKLEGYSG